MKKQSTFSIIGERYLDTQFSSEHIAVLEKELNARDVTGIKPYALEYFAASSLWWNIVWWQWRNLNESDVKTGWILNIPLFLIPAIILGLIYGWLFFIATIFTMHAATMTIGFALRLDTKA